MRLSPTLLSVALLCASGQLMATESRHMGPDGGGSCPDTAAAANGDADEAEADPAAAPPRRTQKSKATPSARSGGSGSAGRSSAPRWHSFLPGMFR